MPTPTTTTTTTLPGPKGWPFFGVLKEFAGDRRAFMLSTRQTHGDLVGYHVGMIRFVQLGHPDLIESVLVGRHKECVKDQITASLDLLLGKGLLTNEGDAWRAQRKLLAPSFQPRHLGAYAASMVAHTDRAADALTDGVHDVHHMMTGITLGIVLETLFGADPADTTAPVQQVGAIMEAYVKEFERMHFGAARLIPGFVPGGPIARTRRIAKDLDVIFRDLLRVRREHPPGDDMLSRMLEARDEQGQGMSDAQLRDEAVTMFMAGHETTAVALTYALYELARHPEYMARIRAEVDAICPGRAPTAADVGKLTFTDAFFKETMRLYPPAWIIGREVARPFELGGVTVRPGTQILMSQWVVHRDPRWFADPEAFTPDRWLDGLAKRLPAFAYFPFGGGPRICIGNHFAMMEGILVLAALARRLDVTPTPDHILELTPAVTLRPRGKVPLHFKRR